MESHDQTEQPDRASREPVESKTQSPPRHARQIDCGRDPVRHPLPPEEERPAGSREGL